MENLVLNRDRSLVPLIQNCAKQNQEELTTGPLEIPRISKSCAELKCTHCVNSLIFVKDTTL